MIRFVFQKQQIGNCVEQGLELCQVGDSEFSYEVVVVIQVRSGEGLD